MFGVFGQSVLTLDGIRVEGVSANGFVIGGTASCVVRNSVFERLVGGGISMLTGGNVELQGVTVSDCPAFNPSFLTCFDGCVWLSLLWCTHYKLSRSTCTIRNSAFIRIGSILADINSDLSWLVVENMLCQGINRGINGGKACIFSTASSLVVRDSVFEDLGMGSCQE